MADKILISEYKTVKDNKGYQSDIYDFIKGVRDGKWQDIVLKIRTAKTKEDKDVLKKQCPAVTVSGVFDSRSVSGLRHHSGFIAMDIDNMDNANTAKKLVENDPYVYAAFVSVSGNGLCLLFKIDGSKHEEAFKALDKYLYEQFNFIADKKCADVSRLRIISYDPYMYINEDANTFKKYLPKPKQKKQPQKVVFVNTDFDNIVKSIYDRGLNICEDYGEWLRVCYAIVSEYGDSRTGRDHFDTLSRHSSKYNEKDCTKQYDVCLSSHKDSKAKLSTISHIYDIARRNGIETYSIETKDVIRAASSQSKSGVSRNDIAKGLEKFNQIPQEQSIPIIDQVISQGIEHQTENIIEDIIHFLQPYGLRKNLLTRNVEMNGKAINDDDLNTLFIDCKSMFEKASKDLVLSVIFSNKTQQYNPIKELLEGENKPIGTPNLDKLLSSIITDTENYKKWVTKWLVACVASAYGEDSPLTLVLSGEKQGTGKTHWFRRLLPKELRYLYGESKMDKGKDDEILMTKKLIIMDDEYGGKSKKEDKKFKDMTSKEFINIREPYGKVFVDLRRIAMFAGTSNDTQIISDPTGNRRTLPIHIIDIDQDAYNSCNKKELWVELYHLYKDGYDFTVLKEDIQQLAESSEMFNASSPEEELLFTRIGKPENQFTGDYMTATEIIKYITSDTKYVFSNVRIGMLLSKFGFEKIRKKRDGNSVVVYHVLKLTSETYTQTTYDKPPF